MKVTLKFYFDDGSEIESELYPEDWFEPDPDDPDWEPCDQEAMKSNIPDIDFMAFIDDDKFFDWFFDPSGEVHYNDLFFDDGSFVSARVSDMEQKA